MPTASNASRRKAGQSPLCAKHPPAPFRQMGTVPFFADYRVVLVCIHGCHSEVAEIGDSPHLCEAPAVPFRQMGTALLALLPTPRPAEVNGNRTHLGPLRAPHWF